MADYDWSSKDNPELQQKMNDAVDKAVNDYLGKIKSGEISFPNNLQLEIDKIGNKTRHDIIQSQSDQPKIFSETLQEGLDTSNIKQKQKRSREQELLDEMNQTRLSDEDWLEQADARQLMASSGMFGTDATYVDDTNQGILGKQFQLPPSFWDSAGNVKSFLGSKNDNYYDANTMEGLASIGPHGWDYGNQWQTAENEDDTQSVWRSLFSPQNIKRGLTSFVANKAGLGMFSGIPGLVLSMFGGGNRGPVINPSTQRFMQNYNVGRNPITGRMTSGPFAGRNLPGTSMFGSKTPQQMAQNWMSKYGSMDYNTERQIAKQKEIRDIAAGNLNLPPSERIVKPTITPRHGPHQYQGGNGNQGNQGSQSHRGGAPTHSTRDLMAYGGLGGLWQR